MFLVTVTTAGKGVISSLSRPEPQVEPGRRLPGLLVVSAVKW